MEDSSGGSSHEDGVPSLVSLCLASIAADVGHHASKIHVLPLELAERLFYSFLPPRPSLEILQIFARSFWKPSVISLSGAPQGVTALGMQQLSLFADRLVRLDLSDCWWLQDLSFLQSLPKLECLKLRSCTGLMRESLAWIGGLRCLQCLDLENVCVLDGDTVVRYVTHLTSLRSLNLSRTGAGDRALDALTYGLRLRQWQTSIPEGAQGRNAMATVSAGTSDQGESGASGRGGESAGLEEESKWPVSKLRFLQMRETAITDSSVDYLMALEDLVLLDASGTRLTSRSLGPVRSKFGLSALPNNAGMLFRSNALLVAASVHGECGCLAMISGASAQGSRQASVIDDTLVEFEKKGVEKLLRQASEELSGKQLPPELEEERQRLEQAERERQQRFEQMQAELRRLAEQDRVLAGQLKWNMRHKLTSGLTIAQKRALESRQFHLERERDKLCAERLRREREWLEREPPLQPSNNLLMYLNKHHLEIWSIFDPSLRPAMQPQIPFIWPQGPIVQPHGTYPLPYYATPGPLFPSPLPMAPISAAPSIPQHTLIPLYCPQGLHQNQMSPVQAQQMQRYFYRGPAAQPRGRVSPPLSQCPPMLTMGSPGPSPSMTSVAVNQAFVPPQLAPQQQVAQQPMGLQPAAMIGMPFGTPASQPQQLPLFPVWTTPPWP